MSKNKIELNFNIAGNIFNSIKELKSGFIQIDNQIKNNGETLSTTVNTMNVVIKRIEFGVWLEILNEVENSFRKILQTGVDFEQSIADLSAITGIVEEDRFRRLKKHYKINDSNGSSRRCNGRRN